MIYTIGYRDIQNIPKNTVHTLIETTSRSRTWTQELSPFIIPCGSLYDQYSSINVENGWQYSKVYTEFVDDELNPTSEYFHWAQHGWKQQYANRYPMGKGRKPLYCYWNGSKLGYIDSRKRIYIPLYRRVIYTQVYQRLLKLSDTQKNIYLLDFDAELFPTLSQYNTWFHQSSTDPDVLIDLSVQRRMFDYVLNRSSKKMGHAYVLWALLLNVIGENEILC